VKRLVFVAYPGITALDLVGPHEVFAATGAYDITIAAPDDTFTTTGRPDRRADDPARTDRCDRCAVDRHLVVCGATAPWPPRRRARARSPRRSAAGSRRCARRVPARGQECSTAGDPLAGVRVARRQHPITVDKDPIFVRDGDVLDVGRVTAGMDLALALVTDDLGRETALRGGNS
jgi:hypothetical protein